MQKAESITIICLNYRVYGGLKDGERANPVFLECVHQQKRLDVMVCETDDTLVGDYNY